LKRNATHQFLVYADNVNILGGSVCPIKNAETLLVASKPTGLKINADKLRTYSCLEIRMLDEITV